MATRLERLSGFLWFVSLLLIASMIVLNPMIHDDVMNSMDSPIANGLKMSKTKSAIDLQLPDNNKEVAEAKLEASSHSLAGLSCEDHGGPKDFQQVQEVVYWKDIPNDNRYVSPFHVNNKHGQFLTFEPDHGGWNNIRMGMETVLGLGVAMGRTLVLPPATGMYLLSNAKHHISGKEQESKFSFAAFFEMQAIHDEHAGLNIITMEEFLRTQAMQGRLVDPKTGKPSFPPGNRTSWDGMSSANIRPLFNWLRKTALVPEDWNPEDCLATFPSSSDPADAEELLKIYAKAREGSPKHEDYIGKPVGVNASAIDRLKENWGDRKKLCIYDKKMQDADLIHFKTGDGQRMLVYFYAFLFFQDWHQDLWLKRFIRDHVRYADSIQCAAGRVVAALRKRAYSRDPEHNPNGVFHTMHVRRGDFQYKKTRVSAEELLEQARKVLPINATVFIATDERDRSFFDPLKKFYDVVVLGDFAHDDVLGLEVNTNYFGMIDQLVAARGRFFLGCWFSTFTASI